MAMRTQVSALAPWYPRSFVGLLVAGFLLVALPLAGGLLYSAWSAQQLAEHSRNAVFDAAQASRSSRSLVNRVGSLERLAHQLAVVREPEVVADFDRVHHSFVEVAGDLSRMPLDSEQLSALQRTVTKEKALYERLMQPQAAQSAPRGVQAMRRDPAGLEVRSIATQAGELAEAAYEVMTISYLVADREVEKLRSRAEAVQRQSIVLVLIALAAALAIAFTLARMIARPIAALDSAIHQLGSADFSQPIVVNGPRDLRQLGDRLDWLRRRLTELEAQKNRFLRHLSHELKTPLTALREGAELLNDEVAGPLAPGQHQVVSIMRENSVKLQKLIQDLLDYQRALHAAAALELKRVRLDSVVREAVEAHRLAALTKGQRLTLELAPLSLEVDAEKLHSIVDNLVGNAVKFTPPGGTISVLERETPGGAAIEVIDSGPGVPAEERHSVFDLFYRGRAKAGGRIEGSGLGLAIAREFVEAHGGRITIVSGTRGGHFRVTLPKQRPAATLNEVESEAA
jgi:two-component system sensor histidine kinase GlrK